MADGVPQVFGLSKQLLLNKFFDPSTPSMRKGHDGGKKNGKNGGKKTGKKEEKRLMEIVATTSFASSRPPERRPLERRTLAPKILSAACCRRTLPWFAKYQKVLSLYKVFAIRKDLLTKLAENFLQNFLLQFIKFLSVSQSQYTFLFLYSKSSYGIK